MKRPAAIWIAFAVCAFVGLGILGWFTRGMLQLERESADVRRAAAVEENVRLALWRLDSAMAVILGTESARSPAEYEPFMSAGGLPSPLFGRTPPFVRLHFQVHADGTLTSPQALAGRDLDAAWAAGVPEQDINRARDALQSLRRMVDPSMIRSALSSGPAKDEANEGLLLQDADRAASEPAPETELAADLGVDSTQLAKSQMERQRREELLEQQTSLNIAETRRKSLGYAVAASDEMKPTSSFRESAAAEAASAPMPAAAEARMDSEDTAIAEIPVPAALLQPLWFDGELFLARSEKLSGDERIQAVWLDWPELRAWLLARITDLLPEAQLAPVGGSAVGRGINPRRLAFLPVQVVPGFVPVKAETPPAPLGLGIGAAWVGALLGIAALALLLHGTLRLSERRGAFVSAVTHELRTPLTTFRMYTEMLSSGMVPDEAKRLSYVETLRREAERLSHLVENVLSYARLERGRAASRIEETTPARLLDAIADRLRQRAEQAGMDSRVAAEPNVADLGLETDVNAVEQIVFNLVDNAAKYGGSKDGRGRIEVTARCARRRRRIAITVADQGPGISPAMRAVLFRPFSKSATEAAHSRPGVGLGLALCRRLARQELRGDLTLERSGPDGTVFRLEIPLT